MTRRRTRAGRAAILLAAAAFCAACTTRPLTESERGFAATVLGDDLAPGAVTVTRGSVAGLARITRPPRPHKACRERIFPPETEPVTGRYAALALENHLYVTRPFWLPDYLDGYPETLNLPAAMLLAHELTHVWQWQNRDLTGYAPWKAAREHAALADPYLFEVAEQGFLDYPFEQQAALVEEFVCCRALDPEGARTERLHALLSEVFPDLPRQSQAKLVGLPWQQARTEGICSL